MSDQNEREAYNEAAREYYEGKEREEMDRPLFTQREMDAAISAAVQEERKAIKAHINSEAFMPSKEYDRASHRIDAWESGVCDVVEYLDSRGPAPAVVCPECDGERWHEYENPLTGEITNRTPCATCNGSEEVSGPTPAVDVMASSSGTECVSGANTLRATSHAVTRDIAQAEGVGDSPKVDVMAVVREYVEASEAFDAAYTDPAAGVELGKRLDEKWDALRALVDGGKGTPPAERAK